jgi:hypothetical protein
MNQLRCCEGCSRHVLISERECPFCQRVLAPLAERVLPNLPAGLSRAQRLAIAAAMASQAMTACAETSDTVAVPIYGAPIAGSSSPAGHGAGGAGGTSTAGRGSDAGKAGSGPIAIPVYGAPVAGFGMAIYGAPIAGQPSPKDAAPPDQDADSQDAGSARDSGQMVHPLYGAPSPVYGAPIPPKR